MIYQLIPKEPVMFNNEQYDYTHNITNIAFIDTITQKFINLQRKQNTQKEYDKSIQYVEKIRDIFDIQLKSTDSVDLRSIHAADYIDINGIRYDATNIMIKDNLKIISSKYRDDYNFFNTLLEAMLNKNNYILASYAHNIYKDQYYKKVPNFLLGKNVELTTGSIIYLEPNKSIVPFNLLHNPIKINKYIDENIARQKDIIKESRYKLSESIIEHNMKELVKNIYYENNNTLISKTKLETNDKYITDNITFFFEKTYKNILELFNTKSAVNTFIERTLELYRYLSWHLFTIYLLAFLGRKNALIVLKELEILYNQFVYNILPEKELKDIFDITKNYDKELYVNPLYRLYAQLTNTDIPEVLEDSKFKNTDEVTETILHVLRATMH